MRIERRQFIQTLAFALLSGADTAPIQIDRGRQLLFDDFLIEDHTLERVFHLPELYADEPILWPETALEMNGGRCPTACPFTDGLFYDPIDRIYKMWYEAGWFDGVAYATSEDGIHWIRPRLDVTRGTNRVLPVRDHYHRDAASVWLDQEAKDPGQRYKMFVYFRKFRDDSSSGIEWQGGTAYTSADGIHWTEPKLTGPCGDNTSFYYDPLRKLWVYSIRSSSARGRARSRRDCGDFLAGASWQKSDLHPWLSADDKDLPDPTLGYQTQLYDFEAVGYESIMLGMFLIFRGPPNDICAKGGFPKITDLTVAYSRDGVNWQRPDRRSFIASSRRPGTWNRGYIHATGGICTIVGDRLHFYFSTFSGISPKLGGHMYAGGSTGLATLRRDGFVSLDGTGTITTRGIEFTGRHLFLNANASGGELVVEVLDKSGKSLPNFTVKACEPVRADKTCQAVRWRREPDLSSLRGKPVRFRFHLTRAKLYAFWVSHERTGASMGFTAAGGPGFTGPVDTVGAIET